MKITFIQTGGTIDKGYPSTETTHGYNFIIGDPAYISILEKIDSTFEFESTSIVRKDSLDFSDEDRERILEAVRLIKNDNVVITHGTDTIYKTAEKLSAIKDKKVVLTGAMLPEEFAKSDAMFNVGMAVGALHILKESGVYIALYGVVVPWDKFPDIQKKHAK
ncbi:asparaginase domain-containing protein [Patescibacteria group bacterium]